MRRQESKVFISCGQRTDEEKELGKQIQSLVQELTPFQPYFAEYQTTLDGLSKNIFSELYNCQGFITIMHCRGGITQSPSSRASVWVEQEIAIAAFIKQVLKKEIHVLALSEPGIALEGVRQQLLLNPMEFQTNDEALIHIRKVLPSWTVDPENTPSLELSMRRENKEITSERHDYDYIVEIKNTGSIKVDEYYVDLEFPRGVLLPNVKFLHEVKSRSNNTHIFLRAPIESQMETIFPGDTKSILRLNYYVDNKIYRNNSLMELPVTATLYDKDRMVCKETLKFNEIQNF